MVLVLGVLVADAGMSVTKGDTSSSVTLAWDASPDSTVVGYFLYRGDTTASYSDRFDVRSVTAATIMGLHPGSTNYFVVTAYNAQGFESVPSNEISYIVPGTLQASLQPDNTLHLLFPIASSHSYDVQYSDAFTNWTTLTTIIGQTNIIYDLIDSNFSTVPKRFYRLVLH